MTRDAGDIVVRPGEGETITAGENRDVVLLADRDQVSMTWSRYGPKERGPDPHVHREHTDAFYVLEGELTYALGVGGERVALGPGDFVAVPPRLIHSFVNEGDTDARFLNFHAPDGGFAAFVRAIRDGVERGFDSHDPPADGGLPPSAAILTRAGEGERLESGTRTADLKCVLPELFFAEFRLDGPLGGLGPDAHEREVDSYYVLEGELEIAVGDSKHHAGQGTLVSVPAQERHAFRHQGECARFLNVHTPDGGFGEYLRSVSRRAAPRPGRP